MSNFNRISYLYSGDAKNISNNLAQALERSGIPVIYDSSFYPDQIDYPYLALGIKNNERIQNLYLRSNKYVYTKNKSMFSLARKMIREFYRNRSGKVKSSNKIIVVESPDNCMSLKLYNRGFKTVNPYYLADKILKKDRKGAKNLLKKIEEYNSEFVKFANYLQKKLKTNEKNKYNKIKNDWGSNGPVANVAAALSAMQQIPSMIVRTHYLDKESLFPYIEIKAEMKPNDIKSWETLTEIHSKKNGRLFKRLQKHLVKFKADQITLGLPSGYGCSNEEKKYNDLLGIFAIYTPQIVTGDSDGKNDAMKEIKEFITYLK